MDIKLVTQQLTRGIYAVRDIELVSDILKSPNDEVRAAEARTQAAWNEADVARLNYDEAREKALRAEEALLAACRRQRGLVA